MAVATGGAEGLAMVDRARNPPSCKSFTASGGRVVPTQKPPCAVDADLMAVAKDAFGGHSGN